MQSFLPIFVVNRFTNLEQLQPFKSESFGLLATYLESDHFLQAVCNFNQPCFIDSGVFAIPKVDSLYRSDVQVPWYFRIDCYFSNSRWHRRLMVAMESALREKLQAFLDRCDRLAPDYVLAPDIFQEPILSLYLARLTLDEYQRKPRSYDLIGVAQVGDSLYHWAQQDGVGLLPHYQSPHSFVMSLLCEYRRLGYQRVALGGLLRPQPQRRNGLQFGLTNAELDQLLSWSRPEMVLGGLALTRLPVLKKYGVWADSSTWIWWDPRYSHDRPHRTTAMAEVFRPADQQPVGAIADWGLASPQVNPADALAHTGG